MRLNKIMIHRIVLVNKLPTKRNLGCHLKNIQPPTKISRTKQILVLEWYCCII